MTAVELYEKETGKKSPDNQIAYLEWHIDYIKWLEKKVVRNMIMEDPCANNDRVT